MGQIYFNLISPSGPRSRPPSSAGPCGSASAAPSLSSRTASQKSCTLRHVTSRFPYDLCLRLDLDPGRGVLQLPSPPTLSRPVALAVLPTSHSAPPVRVGRCVLGVRLVLVGYLLLERKEKCPLRERMACDRGAHRNRMRRSLPCRSCQP